MTVLLWLAIPLAALIIGIVWAYVLSRPPRPAAMQESMESFSRFRTALAAHQNVGPRQRKRKLRSGGHSADAAGPRVDAAGHRADAER